MKFNFVLVLMAVMTSSVSYAGELVQVIAGTTSSSCTVDACEVGSEVFAGGEVRAEIPRPPYQMRFRPGAFATPPVCTVSVVVGRYWQYLRCTLGRATTRSIKVSCIDKNGQEAEDVVFNLVCVGFADSGN